MAIRIRQYKILFLTLLQLGIMSIARVAVYRILAKLGYFESSLKIRQFVEKGPFFTGMAISEPPKDLKSSQAIISFADRLVGGTLQLFSHFDYHFKEMPDWFFDPFTQKTYRDDQHWSLINEFGFQNSDVKILWEASRFGWAPTLAQAFVLTRDEKYLNTLKCLGG